MNKNMKDSYQSYFDELEAARSDYYNGPIQVLPPPGVAGPCWFYFPDGLPDGLVDTDPDADNDDEIDRRAQIHRLAEELAAAEADCDPDNGAYSWLWFAEHVINHRYLDLDRGR